MALRWLQCTRLKFIGFTSLHSRTRTILACTYTHNLLALHSPFAHCSFSPSTSPLRSRRALGSKFDFRRSVESKVCLSLANLPMASLAQLDMQEVVARLPVRPACESGVRAPQRLDATLIHEILKRQLRSSIRSARHGTAAREMCVASSAAEPFVRSLSKARGGGS